MTPKQQKRKATGGILKFMDPIPEAYLEMPNVKFMAIMYPRGKGTIRYVLLTNADLKDLVPKLACKIIHEGPNYKPSIGRTFYCHNVIRINTYCGLCEFMNIFGNCNFRNRKKLTDLEIKNKKIFQEAQKDGNKSIKDPESKN